MNDQEQGIETLLSNALFAIMEAKSAAVGTVYEEDITNLQGECGDIIQDITNSESGATND